MVIPGMGPYCATKYALEALAEAYHYELAPLGIDGRAARASFVTGPRDRAREVC